MGVAVKNNEGHSLVVGLTESKNKFCSTYAGGKLCSTDTTLLNGWENTQAIKHQDGAAKEAADYTFADGQNGYIGSYAEWEIINAHREFVDNAMVKLEKNTLAQTYWTSTYSGSDRMRTVLSTGAYSNAICVQSVAYGRPFAKLPEGLEW